MHKTILVSEDIEQGRRLLSRLEGVLRIAAAFWFHFDEEDWKLVVVSPDVPEKGPRALYSEILPILKNFEHDPQAPMQFPFNRVKLESPNTWFYKRVRQQNGARAREGEGLDSYIYKMD